MRQVLVLEEVIAMLGVVGVSTTLIDKFRHQAEFVLGKKPTKGYDTLTVSSGRGQASRQGFVELTVDDTRTQMPVKKAREVGLMLIEAAEAAASDEVFIRFLEQMGITEADAHGQMLLQLREIRQGTREVSWPS